nr:PREDICTED: uncharacterized protein LOC102697835 isoform X2 [Lepisosteus oculatus]
MEPYCLLKSFEAGLPSQSSVYTLPKRNLRCSDAETYYSTVATCEEIISAKEIQLDNKVYHSYNSRQFPVVIALGVLNGVLIIMITVLTYRQFQSAKCGSFVESDSEDVAHSSSQHQDTDSTHHQNEESSLTYATLEVKHTVNGHRPKRRDVNMDTVYSEIEYREIMIHKC